MKTNTIYITVFAFLAAVLIAVLFVLPKYFFESPKNEFRQTRYLRPAPQNDDRYALTETPAAAQEIERIKVNLENGEIAIAALSQDFDKDGSEEQVIAYRNLLKENNPIYLTYIDYLEDTKQYKRIWDAPVSATRPGTVSLFTNDLIGDRAACIILTGMNGSGEHTITVFKVTKDQQGDPVISNIADIKIEGTISIIETERTQAYQLGFTHGASFDIKGRGRDPLSSNEFDQVEITYSYNPSLNRYMQNGVTRIPGAQIETARLRELLRGSTEGFEQFIGGLWYRVAPDMSINSSQYIYFDTAGRELIFYDKNTQQVYTWLSSTSTRYGLYISSQNISVATLRRVMDIELEAIDSIRVKVFEDVRMKIDLSAMWDGSYRKSSPAKKTADPHPAVTAHIEAAYNSLLGDITFSSNGAYEINTSGLIQKGKYAFFALDNGEYLELLPNGGALEQPGRETYRVTRFDGDGDENPSAGFSLQRVRLSTSGAQDFHGDPVIFTPAGDTY
jgi:predicted  nucleic acid-binding Zn-ribbon protein